MSFFQINYRCSWHLTWTICQCYFKFHIIHRSYLCEKVIYSRLQSIYLFCRTLNIDGGPYVRVIRITDATYWFPTKVTYYVNNSLVLNYITTSDLLHTITLILRLYSIQSVLTQQLQAMNNIDERKKLIWWNL